MTHKDLMTALNSAATLHHHQKEHYAGACLRVKHGREGPLYDPYGYTEITVWRFLQNGEFHTFTLHDGLATYLEVDGRIFEYLDYKVQRKLFQEWAGIDPTKIDKINTRIHGPYSKCPHCGTKRLEYGGGYVGEQMQFCPKDGPLWSEDPTPYIE
jgi:hypothetical protein